MISTVCQSCGHIGPSKYVTFCDGCGKEIDSGHSVCIDGKQGKQGHFHQTCTPEFTVLVSASNAKCNLCGEEAGPAEVGSPPPMDRLRHNLQAHGYKAP